MADRSVLEIFLPAFILVFTGFILLWSFNRHRKKNEIFNRNYRHRKIKRIQSVYGVMLLSISIIAMVYAYWPEYYNWVAPIEVLDQPMINVVGIIILKVSLVWIILAKLNRDKALHLIDAGVDEWSNLNLVLYAEKQLITGMTIMFVGFFVTISSLASVLIGLLAIILFDRFRT